MANTIGETANVDCRFVQQLLTLRDEKTTHQPHSLFISVYSYSIRSGIIIFHFLYCFRWAFSFRTNELHGMHSTVTIRIYHTCCDQRACTRNYRSSWLCSLDSEQPHVIPIASSTEKNDIFWDWFRIFEDSVIDWAVGINVRKEKLAWQSRNIWTGVRNFEHVHVHKYIPNNIYPKCCTRQGVVCIFYHASSSITSFLTYFLYSWCSFFLPLFSASPRTISTR